jgi:predicted aspartyl protease
LLYTGIALKPEQAIAHVKLSYGNKVVELKALVDTGASKSVISKGLAEELGAIYPREPSHFRAGKRSD